MVMPGTAGGRRRFLQHAQAVVLRDARIHAAVDAHRIALLEAIQRARRRARLDVRERRDRHHASIGRLDLEIEQRRERRAIRFADLRDHLVAAIEEVEAVDVVAAEQRAELLPDAREIEPEIGDLLAIEHHACFGQIDLQVGVDVQELAASARPAPSTAAAVCSICSGGASLCRTISTS